MTKLRTLILVLVLCGVAPTASADDFWMDSIPIPGNTAPLFGARTYGAPVVVAPAVVAPTSVGPSYFAPRYRPPSYVAPTFGPTYVTPAYVAPSYGAPSYVTPAPIYGEPPCDDSSGFDDYTDLLLLNQLETMNQTLRDIESHMREALHQEAWDRMLGRYRN
jgi:hypothetical protein